MSGHHPLVDITSLNGVESLFRNGVVDPWGTRIAGKLADFFVYSDLVRFTMPVYGTIELAGNLPLPEILVKMRSRDSEVFEPVGYNAAERRTLAHEYMDPAFLSFHTWAINNRKALHKLLLLHREPWVREGDLARIRPRHVFDVDVLRRNPLLEKLASVVGVQEDDILYGFDIILRYPLYGELAGPGAYFLAHPVRELQNLPTMSVKSKPPPDIALSLANVVCAMAPKMTLDEYTSFLHEARGVIRDRNIQTLKPGALDLETVRDIAQHLGLPARLSRAGKVLGVAAGVLGIVGAVPTLGPVSAIIGGLVSVTSALWTGTVGRSAARISWLRWALEWDVERQASDALVPCP